VYYAASIFIIRAVVVVLNLLFSFFLRHLLMFMVFTLFSIYQNVICLSVGWLEIFSSALS